MAGLFLLTLWASNQGPKPTTLHPIQGTIARLDVARLHLGLQADNGRHVDLTTANVDAMRALRTGDYVRVDRDAQGIVLNINKTVLVPRVVFYSRG